MLQPYTLTSVLQSTRHLLQYNYIALLNNTSVLVLITHPSQLQSFLPCRFCSSLDTNESEDFILWNKLSSIYCVLLICHYLICALLDNFTIGSFYFEFFILWWFNEFHYHSAHYSFPHEHILWRSSMELCNIAYNSCLQCQILNSFYIWLFSFAQIRSRTASFDVP